MNQTMTTLNQRAAESYRRWTAAKTAENQLVDEIDVADVASQVLIYRMQLLMELDGQLQALYAASTEAEAIALTDETIRIMDAAARRSEFHVRLWKATRN